MKIAVLSDNTIRGIEWPGPEWYICEYSAVPENIFQPDSYLYQFQPDIILLSLDRHMDTRKVLDCFTKYSSAFILVHNFVNPLPHPVKFYYQRQDIIAANQMLYTICNQYDRVKILDLEELVLEHGRSAMFDSRYYYLAQMKFSYFGLQKVSEQLEQAIHAKFNKRKKCLVLDLDNTLWGGLLADGIQLSDEGPAKAYWDFQRYIKKLESTGIILAVCSKNDEKKALTCIEEHPYMLIRKKDLAAWRINWQDKATNITEIAQELNVGLDSIVFLDDNITERESVQLMLPEVEVPDLPKAPEDYCRFLVDLPHFETFSITSEDEHRAEMYAQERERREESKKFNNYYDFLKDLEIKVSIAPASRLTMDRVAQLSQRTNQFNLNGRKFTRDELEDKEVFHIDYRDRLGNQGIVGAAVLEGTKIIGLYMSCRILGRGVEDAFLAKLTENKATYSYEDTGKNDAIRSFLDKFEGRIPEWIEMNYYES